MKHRFAAATAALAAVALAPAGAVAVDRTVSDRLAVAGSAPSVVTPSGSGASASSPSGGSSGSAGDGSSGSGSSGSGSSGSGSLGDGSSGSGSSGSGSSGSGSSGGQQWPQSNAADSATSGTPVSSYPGVVMVDTVLTNGQGAGTGIVLTSNGVILTNYHVVQGSTAIRVRAANGTTYTAKVLGSDESRDVAVLQLQGAKGLKTASLDTGKAVLGEKVTAVGQGGGQGTLYKTGGSVTATDQQITASDDGTGTSAERLRGLLKTDAQIVPGYSGGPLLNAQGQVIGLDTAASSSTPTVGYAVTIASANTIADQIRQGTKSATVHIGSRAALGVEVSTAGSSATGYGDGTSGGQVGAGVVGTTGHSAAASAGITAGSTITAVSGKQITNASALTDVMDTKYPGDAVKVTWTDADGVAHSSTVRLGVSSQN